MFKQNSNAAQAGEGEHTGSQGMNGNEQYVSGQRRHQGESACKVTSHQKESGSESEVWKEGCRVSLVVLREVRL